MADGQIELANQAASAESGKSLAKLDQLGFEGGRSFVRLVVARPGVFAKPGRAVLLDSGAAICERWVRWWRTAARWV